MKPEISSHYSNDDDRHYRFSRKVEPPWYPPRGWSPDAIVLIISLLLALGALLGVWYAEGGL